MKLRKGNLFVAIVGVRQFWNNFLWDDQKVNRCLWVDVRESETCVVFVENVSRNRLVNYLAENCWLMLLYLRCCLSF